MCLTPDPPKDNSAEIAAKRDAERQANILAGRGKIDEAFTPFNDSYYSGISDKYTSFYYPQLDEQFQDANEKTKLKLASAGQLNSGAGAEILGKLTKDYATKRAMIANQGLDQANEYRTRVAQAKDDLYGLNSSAADPASIAVSAASRAGSIQAPQSYSPLVAAFADFMDTAAIPIAAERRGYNGTGTGLFAPKGSKGSQKVVN